MRRDGAEGGEKKEGEAELSVLGVAAASSTSSRPRENHRREHGELVMVEVQGDDPLPSSNPPPPRHEMALRQGPLALNAEPSVLPQTQLEVRRASPSIELGEEPEVTVEVVNFDDMDIDVDSRELEEVDDADTLPGIMVPAALMGTEEQARAIGGVQVFAVDEIGTTTSSGREADATIPQMLLRGAQSLPPPPPPSVAKESALSSSTRSVHPESEDEGGFEEVEASLIGIELHEHEIEPAPAPPRAEAPRLSMPPPPPAAATQDAAERGRSAEKARSLPPIPSAQVSSESWYKDFFNDEYLRSVWTLTSEQIDRQCDFIEKTLGLKKGATILDVGCGLGLQTIELASRGYRMVGLDLSLPMLSRAADRAQERGHQINFLHADMLEMNFENAFDAIVCWGTTFGYFEEEANRQVIASFHRALKPMGVLLLDVMNRDYVLSTLPTLKWFEGDACVCMEEAQFNYITSRLEVKRTIILEQGRQREAKYGMRLYSLHELGSLMHQTGFRVAQVSGRDTTPGVFFGVDSPQLIMLAERRPEGGDKGGTSR